MTPSPSLPYFSGAQPRLRYWAAYRFMFTNPNWPKNLLLCSVCVLIPIVGVMVLFGYLRDILLERLETLDEERPNGYPDLDFALFGQYLQRGLWPLVVHLVASVVLVPVFAIAMAPVLLIPAMSLRGPATFLVIAASLLLAFPSASCLPCCSPP